MPELGDVTAENTKVSETQLKPVSSRAFLAASRTLHDEVWSSRTSALLKPGDLSDIQLHASEADQVQDLPPLTGRRLLPVAPYVQTISFTMPLPQGIDSGSNMHTETTSDTENADVDSEVDADSNVHTYGDVSHHAVKQIELLVLYLERELKLYCYRTKTAGAYVWIEFTASTKADSLLVHTAL